MRPNLFAFATSELSLDAFLCWLLAWADPAYASEEPLLHVAATATLTAMAAKHAINLPPIERLVIERQSDHIDVLVRVNGDALVVAIENKLGTTEHSKQLPRYRQALARRFPQAQSVPIYFQGMDQGDYSAVRRAGYEVLLRPELLTLLRPAAESGNAIVLDGLARLEAIETATAGFTSRAPQKWNGACWRGFYSALQQRLDGAGWGWVNNAGGGFWGLWWGWTAAAGPAGVDPAELYLQLEEGRLTVRLAVESREAARAARDYWHPRVLAASAACGLELQRPARLAVGETMAIARLPEYRRTTAGGALDLEATLNTLRRAEEVLLRAPAA